MVGAAYARCEDILQTRRGQLDAVARYLLEHETMDREEFLTVVEGSAEAAE